VVVESAPAPPWYSPARLLAALRRGGGGGGSAALEPMAALLRARGGGDGGGSIASMRDALLAAGPGPVCASHVREVNLAEAEAWKLSEGTRIDKSDRVLGFDCGGQQVMCRRGE
jgi:hypothetical protein